MGTLRRLAPLCLGALLWSAALHGQSPQRLLSVNVIYHPEQRVNFSGAPPADIRWIGEGRYLQLQRQGGSVNWMTVDAASGHTSPLFDPERMAGALATLPGVTREEAARLAREDDIAASPTGLLLNPARTGVLVTIAGDLYVYEFSATRVTRLTTAAGAEEEASFSPDSRTVAFVRANNLFVVDVATRRERALTTDGGPQILNGKLDWLYQEEIYGRGRFRGYWWSPDSSRIAFLQLDERPVPEYTVIDHIPYRPVLEVTDYPKAGDPNPVVKLGAARISGGDPVWMDVSAYASAEPLIVNVGWAPDGPVVYQVQNREQTWLDLNLGNADTGASRRVLRETTRAWVNENGNPTWLSDGTFLWFSERTGFKHIYHYKTDGSQVRQITQGRWDVRTLYGVDEQARLLYFASSERQPLGSDIFRIQLDGTGMTRISRTEGSHRATFNSDFTYYTDVWSNVTTPPQVRLHRPDGVEIRVIDANPVPALREYRLSTPEFVEVKTRDGASMDAMLIKPSDFNPARRYPVYQFTYAGPGAGQVRDQWGGSQYMFHQLLAQQGIMVWILDNRSASSRGVEAQWPVYGRLGELELQDLEDGVTWLKQQPFVDASRLLLSGWSYGGFMTAYALTHSTSWAAGIVGAPVTDWRDYDSVYTERYMKVPRNNVDGYRRTAPRFAADRLHGRMLLVHGTMDDNVHIQNSLQFAQELQRAGKQFEVMIYPKARHSVTDLRQNAHLRQLMFDFVMRTVGGGHAQ